MLQAALCSPRGAWSSFQHASSSSDLRRALRLHSADVLLIVTVVLWSFNYPVVKYAVSNGFAPLVYAAFRFGVGSLIFAGVTAVREGDIRVRGRDLWMLAGAVGLAVYVNQMAFVSAVNLANASTVALVFGTLPVFVTFLAWLLGVEQPTARHLLAVVVSFGGVALVAADTEGGLSGDLGGILLVLVAAATWAFYSVVAGPIMQRTHPVPDQRRRRARRHRAPRWPRPRRSSSAPTGAP